MQPAKATGSPGHLEEQEGDGGVDHRDAWL